MRRRRLRAGGLSSSVVAAPARRQRIPSEDVEMGGAVDEDVEGTVMTARPRPAARPQQGERKPGRAKPSRKVGGEKKGRRKEGAQCDC